jgi:serine protease Do
MKLSKMGLGVALIAFLAGCILGLAAPFRLFASTRSATERPEQLTTAFVSSGAPDFREIVAEDTPAVVGIDAAANSDIAVQLTRTPDRGIGTPIYSPNDPFFRFFRDLPIPHTTLRADSIGSGFIVSSDGVILTNAQLVRDADRVAVMLADRRRFEATVLAIDPLTDVAVLKIGAHKLPTVRLGNSDDVAIGEPVLAMGDPYGLQGNAVSGIVSATGRSGSLVPYIQTDVAMHFGNSGGPIVDSEGQVVGINAQIYTTPAGYEGVSYAIPINVALGVESEVVRTNERARLGIEIAPPTPLVTMFQCPDISGALITKVASKSLAARAGLRPGDIILRYNSVPVKNVDDRWSKAGALGPDDVTMVEILRNDRVLTARLSCCGTRVPVASTDVQSGHLPRYPRPRIGFPTRPASSHPESLRTVHAKRTSDQGA